MLAVDMLRVCAWLLWRDIRVIKKDFINNVLDAALLPISIVYISGYILPLLGLPQDYGSFTLIGLVVGMCFNATGTDSGNLVTDLEGPRTISYELSLPLPYWLVCIKIALSYAIKSAVANIWIFPIGYFLLGATHFDLSQLVISKALLMYIVMNLFFGFFSLLLGAWIKTMDGYGRFWIRWGWQIYTIGGAQFSWQTLYQANALLATINLLNPLVYSFEGSRASILGQQGYINFWICIVATCMATLVCAFMAIRIFKQRLDCI